MRFVLLLQAELLKLLRSRVYLITSLVFVVLAVLWPTYCAGMLALADHDMCATTALGWPSSLDQALDWVDGLSFLLMTLLGSWVVGSEFARDTWKMTLPRMASRWPFVLAKVIAGLCGYLLMGAAVVGAWILVATVGGPLVGVASSSESGPRARVDVLSMVLAEPESQRTLIAEEYAWSQSASTVRLQSQDLPPPEPEVVEVALGQGLYARVPRVVGADATGTLPRQTAPRGQALGHSARERQVRLAAVVQAAATLDAFHPWMDRTPSTQDAHVTEALAVAATQPSATAGIWRLLSPLHDGHAGAHAPAEAGRRALPWTWALAGDELVISAVAPTGSGGIRTGDRVVSWQGQPMAEAWTDWLSQAKGGTPGCRRHDAAQAALVGPAGDAVELEVEALDGSRRTVTAAYAIQPYSLDVPRLDAVTRLSDTTWYLDLNRMDDRLWRATLPKLERAERIVFDLRVYSGITRARFLRHLSDAPLQSDTFALPIWQAPGERARTMQTRWHLSPLEPQLSAQVAFLVSPLTISYAETLLGIIAQHELGPTVGETSCGTNGNRAMTRLLDGSLMSFTGIDTLGPDGHSRNRVGFAPVHRVVRTREGILDGRDEVLEAALELLSAAD